MPSPSPPSLPSLPGFLPPPRPSPSPPSLPSFPGFLPPPGPPHILPPYPPSLPGFLPTPRPSQQSSLPSWLPIPPRPSPVPPASLLGLAQLLVRLGTWLLVSYEHLVSIQLPLQSISFPFSLPPRIPVSLSPGPQRGERGDGRGRWGPGEIKGAAGDGTHGTVLGSQLPKQRTTKTTPSLLQPQGGYAGGKGVVCVYVCAVCVHAGCMLVVCTHVVCVIWCV